MSGATPTKQLEGVGTPICWECSQERFQCIGVEQCTNVAPLFGSQLESGVDRNLPDACLDHRTAVIGRERASVKAVRAAGSDKYENES